jgi:hypothetical protein
MLPFFMLAPTSSLPAPPSQPLLPISFASTTSSTNSQAASLATSKPSNTPSRLSPVFATLTRPLPNPSKHVTLSLFLATLTRCVCVSPVFATLTKNTGGGGWGWPAKHPRRRRIPLVHHNLPPQVANPPRNSTSNSNSNHFNGLRTVSVTTGGGGYRSSVRSRGGYRQEEP